MIAIIDYGMGNLRSVQKGIEHVGGQADIVRTPEQVLAAEKVVLPGVGAFGDAMHHLREQGLVEPIRQVIAEDRPFLGICLGQQLLLERSYEDGVHAGLGVVPGEVVKFDFAGLPDGQELKVPHMGWNQLEWDEPCRLLDGLSSGSYVYFVHSYYVAPTDPAIVCGRCRYGVTFAAMIGRGNMFATQFHPEKSQRVGLRILENFVAM